MNSRKMGRRKAMAVMGGAGAALAFACGDSPTAPDAATTQTTTTTTTGTNAACAVTPSETAGPYPSLVNLFRSDVREDRQGTQLTLNIKVVNTSAGCVPVPNANVEIWHCDAAGTYSEYGTARTANFLRGIQTTNSSGEVTFTTIYPGWYQGRATHIRLDVEINGVSRKVTQIAFPESINNTVHTSGVYASKGTNPTSNAADGIFADSLAAELITPAGSVSGGYVATCQVALAV